jgi:hypothetical protein
MGLSHSNAWPGTASKYIQYKYIWLWGQYFDPYLGHRRAYIINLESVLYIWVFSVFHAERDPVWFKVLIIAWCCGNERMADKNVVTNNI